MNGWTLTNNRKLRKYSNFPTLDNLFHINSVKSIQRHSESIYDKKSRHSDPVGSSCIAMHYIDGSAYYYFPLASSITRVRDISLILINFSFSMQSSPSFASLKSMKIFMFYNLSHLNWIYFSCEYQLIQRNSAANCVQQMSYDIVYRD